MFKFDNKTKEQVIEEIRAWAIKQRDLLERQELSDESFKNPSWPFLQARSLGAKKELTKLIKALPND